MNRNKNLERDTPLSQDVEIFKIVTDHFKQDIREFWTRSNFYLLAQIGLFSVFVATFSTSTGFKTTISISIAILGLVIAVFWFIILRGAIEWLRQWRNQVIKLDREIDRFQCYVEVESLVEQKLFLSPSYMTQFLPLIFVITWLLVLGLIFTL